MAPNERTHLRRTLIACIGLISAVAVGNWLEIALGDALFGTLLVSAVLAFCAYIAIKIHRNTGRHP